MIVVSCEEISLLVNLSIASAKVKSLKTPYKSIRPFIHVLIYGSVGSGKSSLLYDVAKQVGSMPYMSLTTSHFNGSVDKTTGILIPPVIWECRNSVLLVDEFYLSKEDGMGKHNLNTLLTLLENPEYSKKIGYRCNEFTERDGDLFCIVKDHQINCKSRFSLIMNTMMNLGNTQMVQLDALKSRCLTIPFYPTYDELIDFMNGKVFYKYKTFKVKENVKINRTVYNKIVKYVSDAELPSSKVLRTLGDLCRVYAIAGFKKDVFDLIIRLAK